MAKTASTLEKESAAASFWDTATFQNLLKNQTKKVLVSIFGGFLLHLLLSILSTFRDALIGADNNVLSLLTTLMHLIVVAILYATLTRWHPELDDEHKFESRLIQQFYKRWEWYWIVMFLLYLVLLLTDFSRIFDLGDIGIIVTIVANLLLGIIAAILFSMFIQLFRSFSTENDNSQEHSFGSWTLFLGVCAFAQILAIMLAVDRDKKAIESLTNLPSVATIQSQSIEGVISFSVLETQEPTTHSLVSEGKGNEMFRFETLDPNGETENTYLVRTGKAQGIGLVPQMTSVRVGDYYYQSIIRHSRLLWGMFSCFAYLAFISVISGRPICPSPYARLTLYAYALLQASFAVYDDPVMRLCISNLALVLKIILFFHVTDAIKNRRLLAYIVMQRTSVKES